MAYIGNTPKNTQRGRREIYEFTSTASQTVYSGADDNGNVLDLVEANQQSVFLNGVRLIHTDDYTISGDVLTLTSAAAVNDILVIDTLGEVINQTLTSMAPTSSGGSSYMDLISKTVIASSTTAIDITGIDSKYSMIFVDYSLQGPTNWGSAKLDLGVNGVFSSAGEYTSGSNTRNYMQLDGGWAREQNAGRIRIYNLGSSTKTIIVSRHIEIEAQASPTWLSDTSNEYFTRNTTQYNSIRIAGMFSGTGYTSGYVHVYGIADS